MLDNLIVIAILGLLIVNGAGAAIGNSFTYTLHARLNFSQVQHAMQYARGLALLHQTKINVCPSYNRISCGGSWQHGLLVLGTDSTENRFFPLQTTAKCLLLLNQSGFSNHKVQIQANGLTNTNGHFSYRCANSSNKPQFNLYFNKALRFYTARIER